MYPYNSFRYVPNSIPRMNPFSFRGLGQGLSRYSGLGKASQVASNIPLSTPKLASSTSSLTGLAKTSKLSFTSILGGAQKGISTINQVIPIYNQIKPMVGNARTLLNVAKGFAKTSFSSPATTNSNVQTETAPEVNEVKEPVNIVETPTTKTVIFNQNRPNKPFFNID